MSDEEEEELLKKRNSIKDLFFNLFRQKGFTSYDSFGFNVWFIQKNIKDGMDPKEYFEDLMNSTPSEDDDIIKTILITSFKNSNHNKGRIYVQSMLGTLQLP